MKRTSVALSIVISCLLFPLFFADPVRAFFPQEADVKRDPELSGKLGDIVGERWFQRKNRILTGKDPLGRDSLEAIYQAQLDRGVRNIPLLSLLLVRESLRALERNEVEEAIRLCAYAQRYSPDYPRAYFTMGGIYWCQNKGQIIMVLREYWKGLSALLSNFPILFFKSLNFLYLVSGALLLTFVAFAIVIGLKYLFLYLGDVKREFDFTPAKLLTALVRVFAFAVPLILHISPVWTLLYWSLLMWGYLARRERQMIVIFLLVLIYVPYVLDRTVAFLEQSDPTRLMSLYQVNYETWTPETEKQLKKWGRDNEEQAEILFTLGLINKRQRTYAEAERYYREAIRSDPDWSECISNLGNVYLITDRLEEAIAQYKQAISLSPEKASYYFNLHRAFARESVLSSDKVGQALEKATRLDPGLVAFHTQIYSENQNRFVIDDPLDVSRLWKRGYEAFQEQGDLPGGILKAWLKGVSGAYGFVSPVLFLVFLVFVALLCSRKSFRKRCPMCGTPSIKFFPRKIKGDVVCFGCNRLFVKKDSIDPKMKERRMRQVERYGRRKVLLRTIFSLIIPGGGHLWRDQSVKGAVFVFLTFILVLKFVYWNGIIHAPITLGNSPDLGIRLGFLLLFVFYYIIVLRSAFRMGS
jgi:tetratricopeptide (TPR) repeat protein